MTVLRRLEVTAAAYSGQEVAGIVIGALFIFLLILISIFSVVLRSRKLLHFRTTTTTNNGQSTNSNANSNQTILGSTTVTSNNNNSYHNGANGRILNGHIQTTTTTTPTTVSIPNGTLKKNSSSNTNNNHIDNNSSNHILSTATNKNMTNNESNKMNKANLIVAMNHNDDSMKMNNNNSLVHHQYVVMPDNNQIKNSNNDKINIINNQLAEQIEMCDYSSVNTAENINNNNNQFINQQQLPMSMSIDMKNLTQASCTGGGIRTALYGNHNNVKFSPQERFFHSGHKSPVIFNQQYDDAIISKRNINPNSPFNVKIGTMCNMRSTNPYNTLDSHYNHIQTATIGHHNPSHSMNNNSANIHFNPYTADVNGHHHEIAFFESTIANAHSGGSLLTTTAKNPYGQIQPTTRFSYDVRNNEQMLMNRRIDSSSPYSELILQNMINQNNHSLFDHQRHVAASVAVVEELQTRFATTATNEAVVCQMKRNNSMDSSPSQGTVATTMAPSSSSSTTSSGQVVRFANTPIVYNYSTSSSTINKQASPLNRIKNDGLNPLMARDSPDEGLGEETE